MIRSSLQVLAVVLALCLVTSGFQGPTLEIVSPLADDILAGSTRIEAVVSPDEAASKVQSMSISVDGRVVCTVEHRPFRCMWDPGGIVRRHHIRVVATLEDGGRIAANLHTKDLGYAERVRTEAVLVPVIVTDGGHFVRGLKQQDFEVFEDGVRQPIASFVNEEAALDLVLAVDVSGSMEHALDEVKAAVKQLLTKLRPGDAATVVGFNDTFFIAAEREKDAQVREEAVDLLTSWGGTALYDATVHALEMVGRASGRKGVVIFSDGDDQNSVTTRQSALARVQASDAMLYTVGFGAGATVPGLHANLESYAQATGGRAFFPRTTKELDGVFDHIVTELAHQYVLSYAPTNLKTDGAWRNIKVQVRGGKYDVRARRGYRASAPERAER
jgi:Ca-activated chloride channel family protein